MFTTGTATPGQLAICGTVPVNCTLQHLPGVGFKARFLCKFVLGACVLVIFLYIYILSHRHFVHSCGWVLTYVCGCVNLEVLSRPPPCGVCIPTVSCECDDQLFLFVSNLERGWFELQQRSGGYDPTSRLVHLCRLRVNHFGFRHYCKPSPANARLITQ
jgi:hypothetical protein